MIEATSNGLTEYEHEIIAMRGDGAKLGDGEMLSCCALGLAEEAAEVACAIDGRSGDADLITELGDVIWYATTAAHRLDVTLVLLVDAESHIAVDDDADDDADIAREMAVHAGLFAGLAKKWLYHHKPLNREVAVRYLAAIVQCASLLAANHGSMLHGACVANLAKLRKRFPSGGFTTAEANARADEKGGA